jgi:hypothetical protein
MNTAVQGDLWGPALAEVGDGDASTDSWCSPREVVDIAHRFWPEGITLDCCSNRWAISLGYVRARVAWTIDDDCMKQPTWDVHKSLGLRRTTCWFQPPYSEDGAPITGIVDENTGKPYAGSWVRRWDAGELWETLALVKLDTSTERWRVLEARASSIVLFKSRLAHYEAGVRKGGSNFCSAMFLMTRADPTVRHRALEAAVGDLGWVYR